MATTHHRRRRYKLRRPPHRITGRTPADVLRYIDQQLDRLDRWTPADVAALELPADVARRRFAAGIAADLAADAAADPTPRPVPAPAPLSEPAAPAALSDERRELADALAEHARRTARRAALVNARRAFEPGERFEAVYDLESDVRVAALRQQVADHSGHIDHTPGGSPNPWTGKAAPGPGAPGFKFHRDPVTGERRKIKPGVVVDDLADVRRYLIRRQKREAAREEARRAAGTTRDRMTWREVMHRANRAAWHVMADALGYCDDDRQDCAAAVLETVASKLPDGWHTAEVPADAVTATRLRFYAQNHRQAFDRRRAQDNPESRAMSRVRASLAQPGRSFIRSAGPLVLTQDAALRLADDLCGLIGCKTHGPAWLAVYAVVRRRTVEQLAAEGDRIGDRIARECGFPDGATVRYRVLLTRGRKIIADRTGWSPERLADALAVRLGTTRAALGFAPDTVSDLPSNFDASAQNNQRRYDGKRKRDTVHSGTRVKPGDVTPNARRALMPRGTVGPDGLPVARRTVSRFGDSAGLAPVAVPAAPPIELTGDAAIERAAAFGLDITAPATPPAWVAAMSPAQRRAMAEAVRFKRQRAATANPADRAAARLAVGLPVGNGAA